MSKLALVTGASSGIGRAFAQRLAADGCDLIVTGRRTDLGHTLGVGGVHADASGLTIVAPSGLSSPRAPMSAKAPRFGPKLPDDDWR